MTPDLRPERAPLVASVAFLLAVALAALVATCGTGRCAEPEPDSVGLRAGVPAPYAGVLLPPRAARSLLRAQDDLDAEREGRALDAEQHRADVAALEQRLAAVEAARRACEADRAPAPHPPAWYERPGVVLLGGVVLGVGTTIAIVAAVR